MTRRQAWQDLDFFGGADASGSPVLRRLDAGACFDEMAGAGCCTASLMARESETKWARTARGKEEGERLRAAGRGEKKGERGR